jgi:pyruvate kinase
MNIPYNRTKIVATMGPACSKKETLLAMIKAGVNVCRLNFSHGKPEDHKKFVDLIREINMSIKLTLPCLPIYRALRSVSV